MHFLTLLLHVHVYTCTCTSTTIVCFIYSYTDNKYTSIHIETVVSVLKPLPPPPPPPPEQKVEEGTSADDYINNYRELPPNYSNNRNICGPDRDHVSCIQMIIRMEMPAHVNEVADAHSALRRDQVGLA